ncbi:MAG: AAA family ATPase [Gemmataceae bacterium]|nr:AAA family ATPase [Gemmataceae bacterium]
MPLTPANQVVAQAVSWLWPKRLPLGKLLILDGDPDLGKSMLALDLCARLSTGRPFPDGSPSPGPANALVLSAEDSAADTIVPRLVRLGADTQRVFVWQRQDDDEVWPWRLPAQLDRLDEALTQTDARLAVIDPIMAFLDESVLCASDQSVRRVLTPLMQLAEKHRCAVLMHRHLNKKGGGRALYRGLGSIAFVAACRFAMLVGRDPLTPGRCVLAQVRNSLGKPQPSLLYRLDAADGELPVVEWLGTTPVSANELLAGALRQEGGPRDQAAAFLEQFLAGGPRMVRDIWEAAQKVGLSARTVNRAKKGLGIRSRRITTNGQAASYWLLHGQEIPSGLSDFEDIDRAIAEMERRFPPPTPLEREDFDQDFD